MTGLEKDKLQNGDQEDIAQKNRSTGEAPGNGFSALKQRHKDHFHLSDWQESKRLRTYSTGVGKQALRTLLMGE